MLSDRQTGHGVREHRCQVSNGTEAIMETFQSVLVSAENANAPLIRAVKTDEAHFSCKLSFTTFRSETSHRDVRTLYPLVFSSYD